MKDIIFDKDLLIRNISERNIYMLASIRSDINPIVEYDANCLKINLMFTKLNFKLINYQNVI